MRDKKDNATIDLPGFEAVAPLEAGVLAQAAQLDSRRAPRPRRTALKQEQISLLEETDTTGLPVWRRDDHLDLTGLPVWAPAPD
ncbi:hypothetical protein G4G28_15865 [Massilia sp. Dwa41.01b]|uniref:hypothetical protein n=1 Tax=Massilia sp. Se16.2.3 TaxID=2709303 RepID=UPI001861975E|nr:hypothetical protein [Massilia sp. Se16.2.3]QNA89578.1 hypothetical protein G4G28_15865 [Massilia sp. Dwa41.01b]QNB01485.1 hypothetical protein G4G31_19445 [Massilia sp. Se16.2.3]